MSNDKNGGSAFPEIGYMQERGMTLRDYFAAKALAALIGFPDKMDVNRGAKAVPQLAAWAYEYADAMLEERSNQP